MKTRIPILKLAQLGMGFKDDQITSVTLRFRRLLSNHGKHLNPGFFLLRFLSNPSDSTLLLDLVRKRSQEGTGNIHFFKIFVVKPIGQLLSSVACFRTTQNWKCVMLLTVIVMS